MNFFNWNFDGFPVVKQCVFSIELISCAKCKGLISKNLTSVPLQICGSGLFLYKVSACSLFLNCEPTVWHLFFHQHAPQKLYL